MLLATMALGCAPPPRPAPAAFRDSALAHRVCAAPDSVLAGLRACELRDQRPPVRVF